MRLVDQYLSILAAKVKGSKWESQLRELMSSINLKFDYLPVKRGGKTTNYWKLPGYSAQQSQKVIDNLDKFNELYPKRSNVYHSQTSAICKAMLKTLKKSHPTKFPSGGKAL